MPVLKFPDNRAVTHPTGAKSFSGEPEIGFSTPWLKHFIAIFQRLAGMDAIATITTANVAAAPGAYSQAHIDTIVALLNEIKAKQNTIIETLKD